MVYSHLSALQRTGYNIGVCFTKFQLLFVQRRSILADSVQVQYWIDLQRKTRCKDVVP